MSREFSETRCAPAGADKAHAWQDRLTQSVDAFFASENPTKAGFIDVLWNKGILDRIAPEDPEEVEARKKAGSAVWDGGRDNPELYWRILYSTAAAKEATERNYTIVGGSDSYVTGVFPGIYKGFFSGFVHEQYPQKPGEPNAQVIILGEIMDRAKSELERRGQNTEGHPIRFGTMGSWNGIDYLRTDRFTGDGGISFQADTIEDHNKIYKLNREYKGLVMPWQINPADFK